MTARRPHGFTLIEVMVALAITAIALMAGLQATGALTRNATRQSDVLLAQLCADNALAQLRLLRQMPAIGDMDQTCEQAGQAFGGNGRDLEHRQAPKNEAATYGTSRR